MEKFELIELSHENSIQTKALWQEVFSEDSEKFVNYYYTYKAPNNHIFALVDHQSDNLCAMLHLTPYTGIINSIEHKVHYIVGVATKEAYRHQGMMKKILIKALQTMSADQEPYTFLMPANPKIYEPYGFSYIYNRPTFLLNEKTLTEKVLAYVAQTGKSSHILHKEHGTLELCALHNSDMEELVEFSNRYLEKQFDVYMHRTVSYYETLQKELYSENGNIFILKEMGRIIGFFLYAKDDKSFVQEAMILEAYRRFDLIIEEKEKKPIIMARILDLEQLGGYITCNDKVMLTIKVKDSLIEKNNGIFLFETVMDDSISEQQNIVKKLPLKIKKIEDSQSPIPISTNKVDFEISIDQLTPILFGYRDDKRFQGIPSLSGVFINEIV